MKRDVRRMKSGKVRSLEELSATVALSTESRRDDMFVELAVKTSIATPLGVTCSESLRRGSHRRQMNRALK